MQVSPIYMKEGINMKNRRFVVILDCHDYDEDSYQYIENDIKTELNCCSHSWDEIEVFEVLG